MALRSTAACLVLVSFISVAFAVEATAAGETLSKNEVKDGITVRDPPQDDFPSGQ